MARTVTHARTWASVYERTVGHGWASTAAGLLLAIALVPILVLAGGREGALGPAIPLVLLVPVLVASALGGRLAGVVVSLVAVALWDWYFIPPFYRPTIYNPRDLLVLLVFLAVALLTGQLATMVRQRADEAILRARISEALYDLSVALIASDDLPAVLSTLTARLRETFDLRACAVLLPGGSAWRSVAVAGTLSDDLNVERSRKIAGILVWVSTTGHMCGLDEGEEPDEPYQGRPRTGPQRAQFWPLRIGTRVVGVVELVYNSGAYPYPQRDRLLATLLNGTAIALEQDRLSREERAAALARESERLKTALLSSVSHDLRTPLAGIKGAASSLLQTDVAWSEDDRRAFAADIDAEADRLARLVSNLLDLSRIEAGAIHPIKGWEDAGEIVERVAGRLNALFRDHPLEVHVAPDLPPLHADAVHLEQVLANLIENAAKYAPPGTPIAVTAERSGPDEVAIAVADRGPGIAIADRERVFDTFYRVAGTGGRVAGTGMGLAIVKGLVEANGGRVRVLSEPGQGSTFIVTLVAGDAGTAAAAPSGEISAL